MKDRTIERGRVVRSKAGRDKGRYLVVYSYEGGDRALVVDGRTRKLNAPKRKNLLHLEVTGTKLSLFEDTQIQALCDADIRKALAASGFGQTESNEEGQLVEDGCY